LRVTCGVDVIEVKRVQDSIERMGEKFLSRVFTQKEIAYCNSKKEMRYQHFSARFAGKEAIFKAISSLLENKYEIGWTDVEILNDEKGRPVVHFLKENGYGIEQMDISLSHLKEVAVASCVVVSKAD